MTTFKCTDTGNAERLKEYYGNKAIYLREKGKWVFWSEQGWRYADIFQLTKPVVRGIGKEASEHKDDRTRIELLNWAKYSESKSCQRNMVDLAVNEMSVPLSQFDAKPKVINCKNGIVDLTTKKFTTHSPDQLHLNSVSASYDPTANCPRWMKFLEEIFTDKQLIEWMQVAAGYSIMGLTTEHCFFLCYGNGRNGKGTFLETINHVLGSYGHTCEFDTFLHKDQQNVRVLEAKGKLRGRRFVVASETNDSSRLNGALIKSLTGGDTIVGTELNKGTFTFEPAHTIWLACNHLPAIKDASPAMWDRVRVIPFCKSFFDEEQEKNLKEVLRSEADGILLWLIEGAYKYLQRYGLPKAPSIIDDAKQEYRDTCDPLSIFIREELDIVYGSKAELTEISKRYHEWCVKTGTFEDASTYMASKIIERVKSNSVKKKKQNHGVVLLGCRLKEDTQTQTSVTENIINGDN